MEVVSMHGKQGLKTQDPRQGTPLLYVCASC